MLISFAIIPADMTGVIDRISSSDVLGLVGVGDVEGN